MAITTSIPLLLKLPPELRDRIFHPILPYQEVIRVGKAYSKPRWLMPALLQTCRQTRADALRFYFANNVFRVHTSDNLDHIWLPRMLGSWLGAIGPAAREALKRVLVDDKYHLNARHARQALDGYYKALVEGGCGVPEGVIYIECEIQEHCDNCYQEDLDCFWTNNPEVDFERTRKMFQEACEFIS